MFRFPKLSKEELGTVYLETETCSKANCHCKTGKQHKSYYHYFRKKDIFGEAILVKRFVRKSEVRRLKARLQYQKNKNDYLHITGDEFLYSGENVPLTPISPLIKRLHVIKNKAERNKLAMEIQIHKNIYGENYQKAMEIEKLLFNLRETNKPIDINNLNIQAIKEQNRLMEELTKLYVDDPQLSQKSGTDVQNNP